MTLAMGSNSKLGVGIETVYGEPASIRYWIDAENESLKLTAPSVAYKGFRGKSRLITNTRLGNQATGGSISTGLFSRGLLWAWEAAMGQRTSSAVDGGSTAQRHCFALKEELKSFTAEVNRDVAVFRYPGLKISSLQLSGSQNNFWKLQLTVVGNGVEDYPSASPDNYETNFTYMFHDMELKVDDTVIPAKEFSLTLNNKFVEDRYGTSKTRFELPLASREITGSFKMDFESGTGMDEYQKFVKAQSSQLVLTLIGGTIEGEIQEKVVITLPYIRYTGETPVVDKAEALSQSLPFDVLGQLGNDEMTVEIINDETAA